VQGIQLVALPDELRLTTKFRKLCDSCGCHNERELASYLAEEWRPRACPLARLLQACGQLRGSNIKSSSLPASPSEWRDETSAGKRVADAPATQGVGTRGQQGAGGGHGDSCTGVGSHPATIQAPGVRAPRQLLLGHTFGLVPVTMSRNPAWKQPLRRALDAADVKHLFQRLDRGEGVQEVAVQQALISDVITVFDRGRGLWHLFADDRWRLVRNSAPRRSWLAVLNTNGFPCSMEVEVPNRIDPVTDLVELGQFCTDRGARLKLTMWLATSLRSCRDGDAELQQKWPWRIGAPCPARGFLSD
jgi:hypothetical protein